jgi:hypothetical protein
MVRLGQIMLALGPEAKATGTAVKFSIEVIPVIMIADPVVDRMWVMQANFDSAQVRDLHAVGLTAGGSDEGAPGFWVGYELHFFVDYLRDPQGNKTALYSDDLSEPSRDD